jgi:S-DNA-T family DNA segregation ATPase FtsK/SpoIIIE
MLLTVRERMMFDNRNVKLDLLALALLALTIFLGASLFGYDPADPPNRLVYPTRSITLNVCGQSGAVVSSLLLTGIGVGAYYLVFSLAVLDALLLVRRKITQPLVRGFGWLLSLAGVTTLFAMALPQLSPGPVIGSGGYLGAAGRGLLELHFANVGAYILVISVVLGGLLLCTDYVLLYILAWAVGMPARRFGRGVFRGGRASGGKPAARRSDLDAYAQRQPIEVRIAGRPADAEDESGQPAAAESAPEGPPSEAPGEAAAPAPAEPLRLRTPPRTSRQKVLEDIEAAANADKPSDYELPSLELLLPSEPFCFDEQEKEVRRQARILEKTFTDFGFSVRVVEIQTGPVIAQFEVELEAGLRLSKITSLADDLAIALRVPSVRIVAPIPGKNSVGIEVPNTVRQLVRIREVIEETASKLSSLRIPIFLGKDVAGSPMIVDLSTLPHLLIAGRTGTGKSVCLHSIIVSMLMTRRPEEVRMLLIDPKMVELSPYKNIPHLMHPVVTDMHKAEAILGWAVEKMDERYHLLARAGVRHVSVYNQLGEEELMERIQPDDEEREHIPLHLPYIVMVADEMADLMMTAAKEVEGHIIRLAQKSRAVGIHLVLATQKPTVDVITGLIKSNLPARICFQVASRTDSRVVLDEMGADKLLGNGDLLFLWPGTSTLLRGQGTYLSDDEIARVIESVATSEPQFVNELVQLKTNQPQADDQSWKQRDELYVAAIDVVVREGRGSVSLLQRSLGIGYGRAARLIDFMAEDGLVGNYNGSQAREVLISVEEWEQRKGGGAAAPPPAPAPRRTNRIFFGPARPDEDDAEPDSDASLAAPSSGSDRPEQAGPPDLQEPGQDRRRPDPRQAELDDEDDAPFDTRAGGRRAEDEPDQPDQPDRGGWRTAGGTSDEGGGEKPTGPSEAPANQQGQHAPPPPQARPSQWTAESA